MTAYNSNISANVRVANRIMLALVLIVLFTSVLYVLPNQVSYLLTAIVSTALIWLLFRHTIHQFLEDPRFRTKPNWLDALILSVLFLAINLGAYFFSYLFSHLFPDWSKYFSANISVEDFSNISTKLSLLFYTGIFAPVSEELVFRGVALKAYEKARSPLFAAIFISCLFSLAHNSWTQLIPAIFSAFILTRAVQLKRSWWLGAIAHMSNNIIVFVLGIVFWERIKGQMSLSSIGILGLIVSTTAFVIGIFWLKTMGTEAPIAPYKREKIWTPALIMYVTLNGLLLVSLPYLNYLSTQ
jgi:membrane protease YdiL (CAAX protease family)